MLLEPNGCFTERSTRRNSLPIQKTSPVEVIEMQFNFVLVAFASHGAPPLTSALKSADKGYRFAPLSDDGSIHTADIGLWSERHGVIDERTETFCPRCSTITQAMTIAERDDCYFVMALTHLAEFDPPGSSDVHLSLTSGTQIVEEFSAVELTEVGFDVVDQWTGLSALANVGYSSDDFAKLRNMQLAVNQFGLFADVEDAEEFVHFASAVAPEHAPFIPVKVIVRFPSVGREQMGQAQAERGELGRGRQV